jgi:hypothetical protein
MHFEGAVIKEQGVTFGIVVCKPSVLNSSSDRTNMVTFGQQALGLMPIVLMAQDARGVPTYWGHRDIVDFLSHIDPARIPWMRYSVAA